MGSRRDATPFTYLTVMDHRVVIPIHLFPAIPLVIGCSGDVYRLPSGNTNAIQPQGGGQEETAKPNIVFAIADDQSYPYASAYGTDMLSTPGFDYVASHGAAFTNAYVTSPGSSPSRASILTGLFPWQIEEAGTHASSFPSKYTCFPRCV